MGVSAIARRVSLAICNGACNRGPLRYIHGRAVAPRDQDPPALTPVDQRQDYPSHK